MTLKSEVGTAADDGQQQPENTDRKGPMDRLAGVTDEAQYAHLVAKPWMKAEGCTCRMGPNGLRYFTCRRTACEGKGKACGGYCSSCFERVLHRSGPRPEVVVLCGSTKFRDTFEQVERQLGLEGKIVLTVACFGHMGDLPPEACIDGHPTKTALDLLHKQKIDMADRVLVLNVGGYIGSSTRSEIEYAEWFEKPIDYLEVSSGV